MNREPLVSENDVRAALTQLQAEADTSGRAPSVLALARRVGLPNTTLRRRFPDLCVQVAAAERRPTGPDDDGTTFDKLQQDNARLRQHNRDLTENLELAIANIQRLSIDNHALRQALETAQHVTRLPARVPRPR